jgi:hypothetical protein
MVAVTTSFKINKYAAISATERIQVPCSSTRPCQSTYSLPDTGTELTCLSAEERIFRWNGAGEGEHRAIVTMLGSALNEPAVAVGNHDGHSRSISAPRPMRLVRRGSEEPPTVAARGDRCGVRRRGTG